MPKRYVASVTLTRWRDLRAGDELLPLNSDTRHWIILWATDEDLYAYGVHIDSLAHFSFLEAESDALNLSPSEMYQIVRHNA